MKSAENGVDERKVERKSPESSQPTERKNETVEQGEVIKQPLKLGILTTQYQVSYRLGTIYIFIRYCEHSNLSIYTGLFLELSFSKSGGVHDKLHISSADRRDLLLPLA